MEARFNPDADDDSRRSAPRPPLETLVGRALRLRCPRCGEGRLFPGRMRMHKHCPACGLLLDRGPGYYLGSAYINYGITAGIVTAAFLAGRFALDLPGRLLLWPLALFCLLFPLLIFRHSRALWLAMDCHFDKSVLEDEWSSRSDD